MKQEYAISIYLDTRREKASGKYPVKLRVFTSTPRKQKLYPTKFEFTEDEFDSIWKTAKPRKKNQDQRKQIKAVEVRADKVAESLTPFTFEAFDRKLYRKPGDGVRVKFQYEQAIQELLRRTQIGTASTYELSQKSIIDFATNKSNHKYSTLTFYDITPGWLKDYETYMTDTKARSLTTVSIYIRVLRALFNRAIEEKEIDQEHYPFSKRRYQVPATLNVKKALSREQLGKLFHAEPSTPEQQKAKDFWFFSYACNGMNIKDISLLTFEDIKDGKVTFYRAKTRTTSKKRKPITAYLNEFAQGVIEKYGSDNKESGNRVFNIIKAGSTPQQQQAQIKNFTRSINQNLKKLAKTIGLPDDISTYTARHSFATNAVRNGATMEFIQESLGHENLTTTQNYFAGFDDETKKEFADSIMNFD